MRRLNRWKSAVVLGALCFFALPSEARADLVYTWTGTCLTTCTGEATATLTLTDTALDGDGEADLSSEPSFMSFSYTSSDLSFTINAGEESGLTGTFDIDGLTSATFEIMSGGVLLFSDTTLVSWSATDFSITNFGVPGGTWVGPAVVPLPGSLPLFLSGLVAVGLVVFRRRRPKENAGIRKPAPAPG